MKTSFIALTCFASAAVAFAAEPYEIAFKTAAGDSYRPAYRTVGQNEVAEFPLKRGVRYLINPGSIGQPRDGDWRAAFAIFDTETWKVEFQRTPYNLKNSQDRILAANLPQRLATRLAAGR